MDSIVDEKPPARVRAVLRGAAGPLEILAVVAITVLVWRFALGWTWPSALTGTSVAQSSSDWIMLGAVAMIGVGWLACRGRAVIGIVAVCVPVILLSGWRMAVSDVAEWPTSLAALIFALTATCIVAAGVGAWLRHLDEMRLGARRI